MHPKRFLTAFIAVSALFISAANAATWTIDKAHSEVGFDAVHMMISNVHGTFTDYDATVQFDPKDPASLSIDATVRTASVNTNNERRDGHLKSSDFFDVEKFPAMTFKSKKTEKLGDGHFKATGDLTLRDVTKEITLDVNGLATIIKDMQGNMRTAATATATINREDFGLMWNKILEGGGVLVSKDITIRISVELVEQKPE